MEQTNGVIRIEGFAFAVAEALRAVKRLEMAWAGGQIA